MFNLTFQTTSLATLQILLMGACGYFLTKKNYIDEKGLALFSNLLINFFLPCFIFYRILGTFSFAIYPNWWVFPLLSFGVTLVGFTIGRLIIDISPGIQNKREFVSLVAFQNSGYIPLILVATLFNHPTSDKLFVYIFLFLIGFDLVLWSAGVWYLTHHKMERFERRNLIHSPVVAILLSLLLVAFGVGKHVPDFVMSPLKMFGDCTLPLSMLVVGGNLARLRLPEVKPQALGWIVFAKLIILPCIALILLKFFRVDYLTGFLVMLEASVPSATSLSVIARHYGIDETFINEGLVFTHLGCIVTIPVFLMLFNQLY